MAKAAVSCLKGLFLMFNLVFWLTGLALLVVGILVKYQFNYLLKLSTDINYNLAPYILIGCGVFIVLVGFVGCWAAMKEHGWALKIYMVILVLLFLVEVAGAIAGYVLKDKISSGLKKGLQNAVDTYWSDEDSKEAMDKIQSDIVKCCGVTSYKNYDKTNSNKPSDTNSTSDNSTQPQDSDTFNIPKSCCSKPGCQTTNLSSNSTSPPKDVYRNGCYDELVSDTKHNFKIIGGVALGIAVFQLLGVACGFGLTKQFSGNSYEMM